jgi:hypothetical protein
MAKAKPDYQSMLAQGKTPTEIAEQLNIKLPALYQRLKRAGISIDKMREDQAPDTLWMPLSETCYEVGDHDTVRHVSHKTPITPRLSNKTWTISIIGLRLHQRQLRVGSLLQAHYLHR